MTDAAYADPFWEALADGRFLIHRCTDCDATFFPPAPICPHCRSGDVEWTPSTGDGALYSFTRQHATADGFPDEIVVGTVALEDGPRVLAPIDGAYEELSIGDPVTIEPWDYPHAYDRGRRSGVPFFVAIPVDE